MQSYRIYFTVTGRNMRPLFVGKVKKVMFMGNLIGDIALGIVGGVFAFSYSSLISLIGINLAIDIIYLFVSQRKEVRQFGTYVFGVTSKTQAIGFFYRVIMGFIVIAFFAAATYFIKHNFFIFLSAKVLLLSLISLIFYSLSDIWYCNHRKRFFERSAVYSSETMMTILSLSILILIPLQIYLLIVNWKALVVVILLCIVFLRRAIDGFVEIIIILPIYTVLTYLGERRFHKR